MMRPCLRLWSNACSRVRLTHDSMSYWYRSCEYMGHTGKLIVCFHTSFPGRCRVYTSILPHNQTAAPLAWSFSFFLDCWLDHELWVAKAIFISLEIFNSAHVLSIKFLRYTLLFYRIEDIATFHFGLIWTTDPDQWDGSGCILVSLIFLYLSFCFYHLTITTVARNIGLNVANVAPDPPNGWR